MTICCNVAHNKEDFIIYGRKKYLSRESTIEEKCTFTICNKTAEMISTDLKENPFKIQQDKVKIKKMTKYQLKQLRILL